MLTRVKLPTDLIELLLQTFICVVNTQLLETINAKNLKSYTAI
jgi:hypothetical protein